MVEIITQKNSHPSLDWLNFVVTPTARNRIRQWYKKSHRDENILRGKSLLEKGFGKNGLDALLKSEPMLVTAQKCNYSSVDDLLAALGYGEVTTNQVLNRLRDLNKEQQSVKEVELVNTESESLDRNRSTERSSSGKYPIAGVEGLLYHLAGCCKPLPGEDIIGVVTRSSRGISIHRQGCQNLNNVPGERLIPVNWNKMDDEGRPLTYPVDIQIEAIDRVGVLKDILTRLSDQNINVLNAGVKTARNRPALISLSIEIRDRQQFEHTLNKVKNMSDILNIRRVSNE